MVCLKSPTKNGPLLCPDHRNEGERSLTLPLQQCSRIAGTVQHPHDSDLAFGVAVVNRVFSMEMDPQTGGELITARPQVRMRE